MSKHDDSEASLWFFVLPLLLLNLMINVDHLVVVPLSAEISKATGLPLAKSGLLVSVYPIASAISAFLLAPFSDRWGRKKVILIFGVGFSLATFGCGFSSTAEQIFTFRILSGIFAGPILPNALAYASDSFTGEKRAKALTSLLLAFSMASIMGVPIGAWLGERYSWQAPFFILGGASLLSLGLIMLLKPVPTGAGTGSIIQQYRELFDLLKIPRVRKVFAILFFMLIGLFGFVPNISVWLSSNYGMGAAEIGFCYMQGGVGALIGNYLSGYLLGKGYRTGIISVGCVIMGGFLYVATLDVVPVAYTGVMFAGIMFGGTLRVPAYQMILSGMVPIHLRGRLTSLSMVIGNLTMGLGGIWAIPLLEFKDDHLYGMDTVGLIAGLSLLAIPFLINALRKKPQTETY